MGKTDKTVSIHYCNANPSVYFDIKLLGRGNRLTGKMNNSYANIRKYIPDVICMWFVVSTVSGTLPLCSNVRIYDNNPT